MNDKTLNQPIASMECRSKFEFSLYVPEQDQNSYHLFSNIIYYWQGIRFSAILYLKELFTCIQDDIQQLTTPLEVIGL